MDTERRAGPGRTHGLVLMALLLMFVLVGVSALVVSEVAATARAREQETEMLWIGEQYRSAVERYWKATPGPRRALPSTLEQLLLDDRFPSQVHHLRQKYADPFDPSRELEPVKVGNALVGIHSTVSRPSFKRANFPPRYRAFEGLEDSSEWRFVFVPPVTARGFNAINRPAPVTPGNTFPSLPGGAPNILPSRR